MQQLNWENGKTPENGKTGSKHPGIVANLCILRSVVLYFNAQTEIGNINAFVETCQDDSHLGMR